jgi:hypothetical protein
LTVLAKAAQENYEKVQGVVARRANPDTLAKGLQLELTYPGST